MPQPAQTGRSNQRLRTRKDLLEAGARLMKQGERPSLEAVAEEALVSRATAYRYFASIEDLLVEAAVDLALPDPADLFPPGGPDDPVRRLEALDKAMDAMMAANEGSLRLMLANALARSAKVGDVDVPRRQNRRTPLIEAALTPMRNELEPAALQRLSQALALVVGTESMIVFKDVLQLDETAAGRVKAWMIAALVEAARREGA